MNQDSVQALVQARGLRPGWPDIDARLRPTTIEAAYRLQDAAHRAARDVRVGWKVGSTSAAGQRAWGLREPVYAGLFARDCSASLADALSRPLTRPSLECEIAVMLGRDIDGADPGLSIASVTQAIGACHIGCEIIDNRYGDPMAIGVPTLIADDFFQAGFVIGPENPHWRAQDLLAAAGFIDIDGERRTGSVRDILSVFDSLIWLAQAMARQGLLLRAGEVVLTGTLVPPVPISLRARSVSMGITGFATLDMWV